ncbi:MAG: CDP-diacylglycerol--glycerol-3-phosphate 3-phosphatidyltransferase [Desulfatibacillaceae bacterium]|nr:CDP-diacylglycerol--glycerol-3-phosphate 3-phosphatidyltransferase [Desulfatibacillaceae bacterium]
MGWKKLHKSAWIHPNTITLYRILAVPAVVVLLLWDYKITCFAAALVFTIAAITDLLDGYLARRLGLVSNLGKFLDPLADKLLVISALIMLTHKQWVDGWIVCIIVGREIAVTGLRGIAAEQGEVIAAERLGKIKAVFQIVATVPLMIHYKYFFVDFHLLGTLLLWVALVLTVASGVSYFANFFRIFKQGSRPGPQ